MPDNYREGVERPVNDPEMIGEAKSDKPREAPELKINRAGGPMATELKSPRRDMPLFADDEFYAFGKPNQLGKPGLSDFRPTNMESDASNPRHAFDEDNSGINRKL